MGDSLSHLRVFSGYQRKIITSTYRICYGIILQRLVILITGGTKKTQSMDIRKARLMWYDYKTNTR